MNTDRFIRLYDLDGGCVLVCAEDEPRIDAGVTEYIASGRTKDVLLDLTLVDGDSYRIRASQVQSWIVRTRAGRERAMEFEKQVQDEEAEHRKALGIWIEDE